MFTVEEAIIVFIQFDSFIEFYTYEMRYMCFFPVKKERFENEALFIFCETDTVKVLDTVLLECYKSKFISVNKLVLDFKFNNNN